MRARTLALAVLGLLALTAAAADEKRKPPADEPDVGFLEFLGSVDRLAEVNPDYLAQTDPTRVARVNPRPRWAPPPRPPPPPPPAPRARPGENNND